MTDKASIRDRAVAIYNNKPVNIDELTRDDVANLVHELGVHQIELEIQNEELNRTQAELADSRDMYRQLYDFAPVGYLTLDPQGVIERANLTACAMLGVARSDLCNRPLSRFTIPEYQDQWQKCLAHLRQSKGKRPYSACQIRMQKSDSSLFWAHVVAVRIHAPSDDKQDQIRVTLTNITDVKNAQQVQKELTEVVQRQNRQLQDILHATSHDLRSPLITIIGFADELLKGCRRIEGFFADRPISDDLRQSMQAVLNEDLTESAKFVKAAAAKMDTLLKGLLDVSRLGAESVDITTLDVNAIINEIINACQFDIRQKNFSVTRDDLPPCLGEAKHTHRVFANLIHNALKFRDPSRPGAIHISAQALPGKCIYRVADNGIGIRPEDQDRIFDMFYRTTGNDAPEGDGLGLTIVTRILERQNGKIWVQSTPGKGSTFSVLLPTP
ncbi:MAG: PAS domain-containing sensor histidine kinase [Phycisphaerae bacterium]|nr:PAS domain-containing sensor histidine kinase [Phycisphaerae bacterium]